jgi:hypothetical protein
MSPEGFAYYLPALVRIALSAKNNPGDSYLPQFLTHLVGDGLRNARVLECCTEERKAIVSVLRHIAESRAALVDQQGCADQLFEALSCWGDDPHEPTTEIR